MISFMNSYHPRIEVISLKLPSRTLTLKWTITHGRKTKLHLDKANILDLYSGVGSFGIECLSRNVNNVVFVEKDPFRRITFVFNTF